MANILNIVLSVLEVNLNVLRTARRTETSVLRTARRIERTGTETRHKDIESKYFHPLFRV